jgi:hypothetical protein
MAKGEEGFRPAAPPTPGTNRLAKDRVTHIERRARGADPCQSLFARGAACGFYGYTFADIMELHTGDRSAIEVMRLLVPPACPLALCPRRTFFALFFTPHRSPFTIRILLTILTLLGLAAPERSLLALSGQAPDPVPAPAPLLLRVDLPDVVPSGMPLPFRLALGNRGRVPIQVELGGRPVAFDLIIRDEAGEVVWRRLQDVSVEATILIRTLAGGEVVSFEDHWDQRDSTGTIVPPGVYRIQGILPVAGVAGGWGSELRTITISP